MQVPTLGATEPLSDIDKEFYMSSLDVLTHTFSNGLTLAAEIRPSIRAAAFSLLMPTGSAGDPSGKEGLTNVLSDLCYRGAGDLDSRALSDALDAIGMQRSSGADSATFLFGGAVMSDHLERALDLTADIVLRPALDPKELEPVRSLALQDLASLEDQPQRNVFIHLNRAYFTNEYGLSSLGTEESLQSLTAEDMAEAQKSRFKPNGAILSAAGRNRLGAAERCGRGAVRRLGRVGARAPSTGTTRRRLLRPH